MTSRQRLFGTAVLSCGLVAGACSGDGGVAAPTSPTGMTAGHEEGFLESSGARLHFALDLPAGRGPFPAVVIGHGSGRVTKQEGAAHVPHWLGLGFATLRYDKRGVGQSTGTFQELGSRNSESKVAELASDMLAGVEFLRARSDVDGARIGLMGVSQAGWIMADAAQRSERVRFIVAVVGSAMPVATNVYYENQSALPIDEAYARLAAYDGPPGWDPLPALRETTARGLWLLAEDDRLVPTRVAAPRLATLGGSLQQSRTYPNIGHELGGSSLFWSDVASWLAAQGLR